MAERKVVPLDSGKHRDLKLKRDLNVEHVEKHQLIPLVVSEFARASSFFPVIFVKDAATGGFRAAGLVGLEEGENLVFTSGKIHSTYIPLDIRRYPFYVVDNPEESEISLCINELASSISQTEGVPLFDQGGAPADFVASMQKFMSEYSRSEAETRVLIDFLDRNGLLHQKELSIKIAGDSKKISGLWCVDEQALIGVQEDVLLEAHRRNYLGVIYAHIYSLGQINRLLELKFQL